MEDTQNSRMSINEMGRDQSLIENWPKHRFYSKKYRILGLTGIRIRLQTNQIRQIKHLNRFKMEILLVNHLLGIIHNILLRRKYQKYQDLWVKMEKIEKIWINNQEQLQSQIFQISRHFRISQQFVGWKVYVKIYKTIPVQECTVNSIISHLRWPRNRS